MAKPTGPILIRFPKGSVNPNAGRKPSKKSQPKPKKGKGRKRK